MALSFNLNRAVHEVLRVDTANSGSPRKLLTYLMDLLYYGEFRIVEQAAAISDADHTNLIGWRGPRTGPRDGLLLCSTIGSYGPLDWSDWTETEEDPFNPTELDGLLFGVGAAGGKLDLVCKILAASNIDGKTLVRPVFVAGLFGEEARVGGAMYLLDSMLCAPEWAVVFEPTNLELVRSHRGYMRFQFEVEAPLERPSQTPDTRVFAIEVHGEPAHTAVPGLGRNALDLALRTIERLRCGGYGFTIHNLEAAGQTSVVPPRCRFFLRTEQPGWIPTGRHLEVEPQPASIPLGPALDLSIEAWVGFQQRLFELFRWTSPDTAPEFLPSGPLVALIGASGSARPGQLALQMEYRTLPGHRTQSLVTDVEALARRCSTPGRRIRAEVTRNLLPMDDLTQDTLWDAAAGSLREIGVPPVATAWSGSTEAWIFDAAGIPSLAFGPGPGLHCMYRPNEYTVLKHLHRAVAFYERLIRRLCCR